MNLIDLLIHIKTKKKNKQIDIIKYLDIIELLK